MIEGIIWEEWAWKAVSGGDHPYGGHGSWDVLEMVRLGYYSSEAIQFWVVDQLHGSWSRSIPKRPWVRYWQNFTIAWSPSLKICIDVLASWLFVFEVFLSWSQFLAMVTGMKISYRYPHKPFLYYHTQISNVHKLNNK